MTLQKADRREFPGLRGFLLELGAGENGFGGTDFGRGCATLEETLQQFEDMAAGRNLPPNRVRQTVFWLLDDHGTMIGMSKLRGELTEELMHHGGNIGYYIRPSARGKGHGRALLAATLSEARKLGLRRVLITMDAENAASIGTAQSNGGRREDTRLDDKGREFHRYWIDLESR
jgi:predicted acetyltransferase